MSNVQTSSYMDFLKNHCVRDQAHVKNCMLAKLKTEIITISSKISNIKSLLVRDGKFIDFNTDIFTRLTQNLEPEAEELLISSDMGRNYLGEYGPVFIKQLTFCGFCLKIGIEVVNHEISSDDAKLIYSLILNYYLAGNTININNLEQLRKRIHEKELLIDSRVKREIFIVDDFFKMEFPEIESFDKENLDSIKNYLEDERVSNLIEEINDEPKIIANEKEEKITIDKLALLKFDLDNLSKDELRLFTKYRKKCNQCTKTFLECNLKLQKIKEILNEEKAQIKDLWEKQEEYRTCISKVILEKKNKNKLDY